MGSAHTKAQDGTRRSAKSITELSEQDSITAEEAIAALWTEVKEGELADDETTVKKMSDYLGEPKSKAYDILSAMVTRGKLTVSKRKVDGHLTNVYKMVKDA